MDIEIRHTPDCPFTAELVAKLGTILSDEGMDGDIRIRAVATLEQAQCLGFTGSPTILVDGRDPFGHTQGTPALACRLRSQVPSADRLREAIREGESLERATLYCSPGNEEAGSSPGP